MIYLANDADFNEALATTVEEEGVRLWLESLGRERISSATCVPAALREGARPADRDAERAAHAVCIGNRSRRMRREKAAIFAALLESYSHLKQQWDGQASFDSWLEADINNANLASIATYYDCVPGFRRELEAAGGNLGAFYARCAHWRSSIKSSATRSVRSALMAERADGGAR